LIQQTESNMNFATEKKPNKRGKLYNTRPNKIANGYSKHFAGKSPDKFLRLCVYGTFDVLAKSVRFDFVRVTITHPTDFRYTRVAYVLKKNKKNYETHT